MSAAPTPTAEEEISPLLRWLAIVMLAAPVAGLVAHVALYVAALSGDVSPEALHAYVLGWGMKAVAFLAFVNLMGNWFHYRHTRMGLDIASRIMTYLWILSIVLLLKAVWAGS